MGTAAGRELGEGGLTDRARARHGGLSECIIQFGQERGELSLCLHGHELVQLVEFGEGEVEGNHGADVLRIACNAF